MKLFLKASCIFAVSIFYSCKDQALAVAKIEGEEIQVTDTISSNAELDQFIAPYAEHINKEMSATLAYAPKSLSKSDAKYNTAIGNMEADAVMEMLTPIFVSRMNDSLDVVLLNYGGIRASINKGAVTTKTAYNIMPFENEAVVVKLSGKTMQELFQYLAKNQTAHPLAGAQLILNADGSIQKSLIQKKPIDTNQTYYVATNDYLQLGGDHMDFLAKTDTVINMNYKLRNLFIDYFKKKDTIAPVRDQRFIKLEK